jgi:hypothetical protein
VNPDIRPMSVPEILDTGVKLTLNRPVLIFGAFSAIYFPVAAALNILIFMMTPNPETTAPEEALRAMGQVFPVILGSGILSFIVYALAEAAVIIASAKTYLNQETSVGESVSSALGFVVPLLLTTILKSLIIGIGFLLFIIPGIYFMFRYALTSQAVVLEGVSGGAALRRSKEIMSHNGHILQIFVLAIILIVASFFFGMIGIIFGQGILGVLVQTLITTLLTAVAAAIVTVFYFSSRCRAEGYDLQLLAASFDDNRN